MLALPFSPSEHSVHTLLSSPERDNPTAPTLTPQAAFALQRFPLLAIGALDAELRPWTSVWGGAPGLAAPLGQGLVGVRAQVEGRWDPVVRALVGGGGDGEVVREEGAGRMVGALPIDLEARKRVKVFGRMVVGALSKGGGGGGEEDEGAKGEEGGGGSAEVQLVVRVEQSLGNCPKYLNKKAIRPAAPDPTLISQSAHLTEPALALIRNSDLFFISSSNGQHDMDTNHRGGPAGFVRVVSAGTPTGEAAAVLVYPEYSGNRLYQTLGNLHSTPRAGLCFPDFATGDVLYVTGSTRILAGKDAAAVLPRSNVAVEITVHEARFVRQGLPFRGVAGEPSPYNPAVRLLAAEGSLGAQLDAGAAGTGVTAALVRKTLLSPSIARFRFRVSPPARFKPGQWVALDFAGELDMGYSHMRDDDPQSLNDDFIRTFTVSSPPTATGASKGKGDEEFEITIRRVGPVTRFLFQQSERAGLEVPVRGFGGEFRIELDPKNTTAFVPFVAGGVGITPLLGQLKSIDGRRIRLFWTLRLVDVELAVHVLEQYPELGPGTSLYFTGADAAAEQGQEPGLERIRKVGARYEMRRLAKGDLDAVDSRVWYVCAGTALRKSLLDWLKGKEVVYEDFNF